MTESASRHPASSLTPWGVLLLTVWCAVAVGLLDLLMVAARKALVAKPFYVSRQILWMSPLAYLLLFLPVGLATMAVARIRAPWARVRVRVVVFAYVFLGALSVQFPFHRQLHRAAMLVLALGLAVALSGLAASRVDVFRTLVRRSVAWMILLVVLLGAVPNTVWWLRERRAVAALPTAVSGAYNVLLIVLDTVRSMSLSVYGYDRPTSPQLERLARAGVRYDWAITTTPWSLPSHASMLTGLLPHEHRAGWGETLGDGFPTLAEVLSARGYRTAGFVANTRFAGRASGLARGFTHYEDYRIASLGQVLVAASGVNWLLFGPVLERLFVTQIPGRKSAAVVNDQFLHWVGDTPSRPFFAFLNYLDAHHPYLPPEPFASRFATLPRRTFWQKVWAAMPWSVDTLPREARRARWLRQLQDAYDGSIAYLDAQLGQLFDELDRRGLLDSTLVIVTADHGEEFGRHGKMRHAGSLYLPVIHVPLVMRLPGKLPAGTSVPTPVGLADLPATVTDLLGAVPDAPFPGNSLVPPMDSAVAVRPVPTELTIFSGEVALGDEGSMRSLVVPGYHYIVGRRGQEELYAIDRDLLEQQNLVGTAHGDSLLPTLRAVLTALIPPGDPPRRSRP